MKDTQTLDRKPERQYLCWRCGRTFEGFLYREPSGCPLCHRADWLRRPYLQWPFLCRQDAVDQRNAEVIGEWMADENIIDVIQGDIVIDDTRADLCEKACDGISDEALKAGVVEALLKMYDFAKHGDDLLLFGLTHKELDALDKLEGK